MYIRLSLFSVALPLLWLCHASAGVFYVDVNSVNPTPPYSDWSTAATDIQSAIDAASDGDQILVNDGVYQTGGRVVYGVLTNRVVIDKAVTVQSVNGPGAAIIQGYQMPAPAINGDSAVRCVYLTNNAALIGFTLTGGATRVLYSGISANQEASGGGVWCESTNALISNCVITGNAASMFGAGSYSGTLVDCQISYNTNNSSEGGGGGAAYGTLINSVMSYNYIEFNGGGAFACTLSNCVISGNSMGGVANSVLDDCTVDGNTNNSGPFGTGGGGALQSVLHRCWISNNGGINGGGAYACELDDCVVSNNFASEYGGGAYFLANSTNSCGTNDQIIGNFAANGGGAYFQSAGNFNPTNWNFTSWTFENNSATNNGGGLYLDNLTTLNNSLFFTNTAGGNGGGLCCITEFPCTALNCIFAGNISAGTGGGAYNAALTWCTLVGNWASGNGGGASGLATNCVFNGNVALTNGGGLYFYVLGDGEYPSVVNCEFTNNAANNGGGVYNYTGYYYLTNCIFFSNSATNEGGGAYGGELLTCTIISNTATFGGGFYSSGSACARGVIIGNLATNNGGGLYDSTGIIITNCLIENNVAGNNGGGGFLSMATRLERSSLANNLAASGGGSYSGTLSYCYLTGNLARTNGGGTCNATIYDCLLTGNSAANGGGTYLGALNNSTLAFNTATTAGGGLYSSATRVTSCIVYDNVAPSGSNYNDGTYVQYCCTVPMPTAADSSGITNNPDFINPMAGNFRLQTNSPCINSGEMVFSTPVDLDGRPRVVGGKVDMGAYEFQAPGVGEFTAWLQQYGLPTGGSADYVDSDGSGMNNWQKWIAGLNPTNVLSVLKMSSVIPPNGSPGVAVSWESVSNVVYYLQRESDLTASFQTIQSNLVGQAGSTTFVDNTATNGGPYFYRVGVQ